MQTVAPQFNVMSQNSVIPLDWKMRISLTKAFDDSITWFTLNTSQLNLGDILAPNDDNPLQQWDYYTYQDFSDRVTSIEYTREIEFPYSVQSAIADFTLENTDDYFTPNSSSPVAQYIIPKRPIRILTGFKTVTTIPQFVGLTQGMPVVDEASKEVQFNALDYLSEMYSLKLSETIAMRDVRTDQVLAALFNQFGLSPSQYNLARGRNTIPFLFFEREMTAGEAFRKLMQAEMGNLWLDEQGIIRFEPRLMADQTPVMTFDDTNVVDASTTGDDEIINIVRITSPIRVVQEFQTIWEKASSSGSTGLLIVPAGGTLVVEANLQDPAYSVVAPTLGFASSVSWFTAQTATKEPVTSGVSVIDTELKTAKYVMTFENTNGFAVEIDRAEIWGEPAKQTDLIEYELREEESIAKYGEQVLEIENDFFQSQSNCESFAYTALDAYAEHASILELEVIGNPALELGDVINVDVRSYNDTFRIISITNVYEVPASYRQIIRARHYTVNNWFILNVSQLNGTDRLAP